MAWRRPSSAGHVQRPSPAVFRSQLQSAHVSGVAQGCYGPPRPSSSNLACALPQDRRCSLSIPDAAPEYRGALAVVCVTNPTPILPPCSVTPVHGMTGAPPLPLDEASRMACAGSLTTIRALACRRSCAGRAWTRAERSATYGFTDRHRRLDAAAPRHAQYAALPRRCARSCQASRVVVGPVPGEPLDLCP